jgi:hypothetical protein
MGADTVGSPAEAGWTGKLLGSVIGSQFSAPNIAGTTPPPKDQSQDQDQNQDAGASGKQGGAGKGGAAGPTGHKDDPIRVQPVGGGQQPMTTNQSNMSVQSVGSASPGLA